MLDVATITQEAPPLPSITLRDYQETCVQRVLDAYQRQPHGGSALVVMPVGAGKTVVFTEIARRLGLITLIIAHREELLYQAADKFRMVDPTAIIGQVGAGRHEWGAPITVASIQTISRPEHLKALQRFGYQLVIIDECHHSAADGYLSVINMLKDAFVVGVTATPDRLDRQNIENIFGEPVFSANIIEMVGRGYLCDLRAIAIKTTTSLDTVHTQAGDFKQDELEELVDTKERNERVVKAYLEHARGRQALCFAVTVAHAQHLAESFTEADVRAAMVCGETPPEERKRLLHDYECGALEVLCNVGIFTEGVDLPATSCIILARPTQSRALFVQCLDAGTEILTFDGWKTHSEVEINDLVAAFDVTNEKIRWVPALKKFERPLGDGEMMFALQAPTIDIRVTEGHRMIYRTRYGRKRTRTAWSFIEAQDLCQRALEYELPIAGRQEAHGVPLTDDELRFIGWFLTDGTLNKKTGGIAICQAAHQPHHDAIKSCLEGCGFKYTVREEVPKSQFNATSNRIRYHISKGAPRGTDKHLTGWARLEPYIDKNLSPLLEDMTSEQLEVLLEAIHLGDGSKQLGQYWTRRSYHITTGNMTFAERLQSLCVRRGFKCNIATISNRPNDIYQLHIKKVSIRYVGGQIANDRPHLEISPSIAGETVWCVENELGTLVTRRNGKVAIVGNCIGRGTRLAPGKRDCIILDITDNCLKHRLQPVTLSQALGKPLHDRESVLEAKVREEEEREKGASLGEREQQERRAKVTRRAQDLLINLLAPMDWKRRSNGAYYLEVGEGKHRIALIPSEEMEGHYTVKAALAPDYKWQIWLPSAPLEWAQQHAEMKAKLLQSDEKKRILVDSNAPWRVHPASMKQCYMLRKFGIEHKPDITAGEASDLIGKAIHERDRKKAEKKLAQLQRGETPRKRGRRASA